MAITDNIRKLVELRAASSPTKTFLFSELDGRSWSYAEFDAAVNRTANLLRSHGIVKGDVVSLLMPNSAEYVIAYFACWKIGALAGPINSLLKAEEIEWLVENSEPKLILAAREFDDVLGDIKSPPAVTFDRVDQAAASFSDCIDDVDLTENDEAVIIYTSGTSGKPKGCLLTHGNLIANAQQIAEWMKFGENDRLLTVMPLFHMNAVSVTTMTALYAGGSAVVTPKFSASRFWDIIAKYEITSFGSVATMLSMLLARHEESVTVLGNEPRTTNHEHLRFAMCGSAPVPAEVLRKFEETFHCLVIEGYGLSESTCRSTFNPPNEDRRPGSCGLPIGNEMKIVDDEDHEVPDGELGEIVLRGANICKGYFKNPEATAKAFANGWFHTGDIGRRDPDGFFYIADRKSDMIIRGGENIYPREIDDILYSHPAVAQAAVIGVPDELYGEEVAAFVVLKSGYKNVSSPLMKEAPNGSPPFTVGGPTGNTGTTSVPERGVDGAAADGVVVSAQELIEHCKKHLADYKCPKTIYFVDNIPKGPTGKLLKRELTKLLSDPPV
jgi:long-chain acyl-CoA synthetase